MNLKIIKIIFFLSICIFCTLGFAQNPYIHFSPGSKAPGFGGSLAAGSSSPTAIFWNPAILPFFPCQQIEISSHEPFSLNYAAYSHFIPQYGSFGLALSNISTEQGLLQVSSAAWGRRLLRHQAFGVNLNLLNLNRKNSTTLGFGFFHREPTASWMISSGSKNNIQKYLNYLAQKGTFGAGMMVHNLPLDQENRLHSVRLGMLFETETWGPIVHLAYHLQPGDDSFHFGLGFQFINQLRIFGGTQNWDKNQFAYGLEWTDTNFSAACSYCVNQKSLLLSIGAIIGRNPRQLLDFHIKKGAELLRAGRFRSSLAAYKKADAYNVGSERIQHLIHFLEDKKAIQDHKIDSLVTIATYFQRQGQDIRAALNYLKILELNTEHKIAKKNLGLIKPRMDRLIDRLYVRAISFLEQGEYQQARQRFKAISMMRANYEDVNKYIEIVEKKIQEKVQEHYYRGLGFRRQNNLERARQEFERTLEYDPSNVEAKNQLDEINAEIQRKTKKIAHQVQTLLAQANKMMRRNRTVEAFKIYHRILKIEPTHTEAQRGLQRTRYRARAFARKRFEEGERALNQNEYSNAQKYFNQAAEIAVLHKDLKRLYQQSKNYLRQINAKRQRECDRLYELGLQYLNERQWDEALQQFEAILEIDPNDKRALTKRNETSSIIGVTKLMEKGKRYYQDGDFLEAMETFQHVIEIQSDNVEALNFIQKCQANLDRQVEAHFNRALAYYTEENYHAALNEWKKVLEINPNHQDTLEYIHRTQERLDALNEIP